MSNSLSHTKWCCKYHVVIVPKYRKKIIYGKYRLEIGKIIRQLCEQKNIEILESGACMDHIHLCLSIAPKHSVSKIMGYLKGKSALAFYDKYPKVAKNTGKKLWTVEYYVNTVGLDEVKVKNYIKSQEDYDKNSIE
jgi:putative transposase